MGTKFADPRTLGDLSLIELIEGADREVQGLINYVRDQQGQANPDGDFSRFVRAYAGSILARLAMAKIRLRGDGRD